MFLKNLAVKVTFFSISLSCFAENYNFYGLFPAYSQAGSISKKFDYNIFLIAAINTFDQKIDGINFPAKVFMLYDENVITYNINKKLSLSASYTYQATDIGLSTHVNEHRVWEQLAYKHSIKNFKIGHRIRFDNRFIQQNVDKKYNFSHRLRYLVGLEKPITNSLYLSTYNEFFFNTSKPRDAIYGENWAYFGIGTKTKHAGNFEFGPLYITWIRNANKDRLNLWYLQFTWITNLNIHKKPAK